MNIRKYIIYMILLLICFNIKNYEDNKRQRILNEVIDEKEKESHFYYNEFNENYLIDIDGNVYTFTEKDLIYINEYEDIEDNPEIKKYIDIDY